jgi:hypothetical protein
MSCVRNHTDTHSHLTGAAAAHTSQVLRPHGAREFEPLQPRPLPTAVLLVLRAYIRGKRGIGLAQMLARSSLFPQAPPINGLC